MIISIIESYSPVTKVRIVNIIADSLSRHKRLETNFQHKYHIEVVGLQYYKSYYIGVISINISFVNIISESLVFNINLISIIDLVVVKTMVVSNHVPGSTSLQYAHALTCISTRIYITAMRKSFIVYSCRRYIFKTMVVSNHVPGSTSLQYAHALTCISIRIYITAMRKSFIVY